MSNWHSFWISALMAVLRSSSRTKELAATMCSLQMSCTITLARPMSSF